MNQQQLARCARLCVIGLIIVIGPAFPMCADGGELLQRGHGDPGVHGRVVVRAASDTIGAPAVA
jgi:hypothetical protein